MHRRPQGGPFAMRFAVLLVVLTAVGCAPRHAPTPVVTYVPVPQPAAPPAAAPPAAPPVPQAESPPVWHYYNAVSGRCETIARIDLLRVLTASSVAGCVDMIPSVENAFVIVCPTAGAAPGSVQVYGVTEPDCELAQAA